MLIDRSWKSTALGILLAAALFAPARAHAQTDEEKAAARALATQGADALKNNKYGDALDLVTRAEAILHAPTHLLMIARAQVGLGKLVAAQETFLKLLHEELAPSAPNAFKNAQAAAKDELAAIEPKIAGLRIILDGPGAKNKPTVKMDDQPVPPALVGVSRPVDPGTHVISVFPVGGSPVKGSIDLKDGEKKDIKLNVPEGPPPSGIPTSAADNPDALKPTVDNTPRDTGGGGGGFFTPLRGAGLGVGAVGLAGVAVGAVFLAKGFSTQSSADARATMIGCKDSGRDCRGLTLAQQKEVMTQVDPLDKDAATQKTIGVIGVGVGVAALGAGAALIILGKPKPAAAGPAKAGVAPWFFGTGGGVQGQF